MAINESRKLRITERIFTRQNIQSLAKVIANQVILPQHSKDSRILFTVYSNDNSTFSSKDLSLFDDESPIFVRNIERIRLKFNSYSAESSIDIELTHGNSSYGNQVVIEGIDSHWVNGTLKQIEELMRSFSPQESFIITHRKAVQIVMALSIGILYQRLLSLIPLSPPSGPPPDWALKLNSLITTIPHGYKIVNYIFALMGGWFPAKYAYYKLRSFWPSIELQVGPEHYQIEKLRRKAITAFVVLGILPILTSFVYDLIK